MIAGNWGMGAEWVTVPELLDAGRTVVTAAPGMGKTQLLRVAGRESRRAPRPLLCQLKELPGLLDDAENPLRGFARFVADGQAFHATTPVPSRERLEEGTYIFLLDALDEVTPGRRGEVIDAVLAAVQRWPQHGFVVTTRPSVEAMALIGAGFRSYRIVPSGRWGIRYLQRRGVDEQRLAELRGRAPTASNLLGIPIYAAAIGERLVTGHELTDRPIDLLLDPVRALAQNEAQKQGKPLAAYLAWLQRLAVGLELRGRNEATTAELAALPGPEAEDPQSTRERLVQAALLNDIPDRAEFPESSVQEALCADALLECADVVAAVRAVAAADLGGEVVLRGDIEHCLDQVWANASAEQRESLRSLDELRWARTIGGDCTSADGEDAFDIIWKWYQRRRLWMNGPTRGQLRSASEAITLLTHIHPEVVGGRREELIGATQSPEPTVRGNALQILSGLQPNAATAGWVVPLLCDDNDVVRRDAANAVARLGVRDALPVLREMFPSRTDELEVDAYARALIDLIPDGELGEVADLLRQNGRAWAHVSDELITRLSLDDALEVLNNGVAQSDEQLALLRRTLEQHPSDSWNSSQIEKLATAVVRHDVQPYEDVDAGRLQEIVARHPEAALLGIREAARHTEVHWTNLFFVEPFPDELLRTELNGPLADVYALLLERKAALAATAETPKVTVRAPRPGRGASDSAADVSANASSLGRALDDGSIREDSLPGNPIPWNVDDLTDAQRERLTALVDAWWPDRPLRDVIQHTGQGVQANNAAVAAVCAAAALDLPMSDERWLDVFATPGVMVLQPNTTAWLSRHFRPELDDRASAIIRATDDEWHLYYAISAIAELHEVVAEAFVERLYLISEPLRFGALLQTLISAGHRHLLDQFEDETLDAAQRAAVLEAKATAGDVDAQLALVADALAKVECRRAQPSPALRPGSDRGAPRRAAVRPTTRARPLRQHPRRPAALGRPRAGGHAVGHRHPRL